MPGKCLRGAVIEIDLNPTVGHEQAKVRPCVVVQNDVANAHAHTTIVAPVTGAENIRRLSPVHVLVCQGEGGLSKDSVILCDQVRTVDERRFLRTCGHLKPATIEALNRALKISLDLLD
jgi:mRNA interferase MazF